MLARTVAIAGKRLVILEEADYLRLVGKQRTRAGPADLPPLPPRNSSGRRPAAQYIITSIARDIIRERKSAGLTQAQLSKRARVPRETLARIEAAKEAPTPRTLQKIERALKSARLMMS